MDMCLKYDLEMPCNMEIISNEEMEYLDGGKRLGTISAANCNKIAAYCALGAAALTVGGAAVTLIATLIGTPVTGAVAACISTALVGCAGGASAYFWLASCYKGMNVNYNLGVIQFVPKFK